MKFTIKDSKSIADFMTSQDFDRNNQWIQSEVTEMNSNAQQCLRINTQKQDSNGQDKITLLYRKACISTLRNSLKRKTDKK